MKLSLLLFILSFNIYAQNIEVLYEKYTIFDAQKSNYSMTVNDVKLSKSEVVKRLNEQMKIPKEFSLITNKEISNYKAYEKIDNNNEGSRTTSYTLSSNGGNGDLVKQFVSGFYYHEADVYGKKFVIKDTLQNFNWVLTKETKTINGFNVKKATAKIKDVNLTAWYAVDLPYKTGPDKYQGLPGLILEVVQVNNDDINTVISYKSVSIIENKKNKLELPKKGKIVSLEEYKVNYKEIIDKQNEMISEGVSKD